MATLKLVKPTSDTLANLIEDYLSDCARGANGHRKLSAKTVKMSYGYPLREIFLPWAEREGIRTPAQLTQAVIDRFSEEQKNRISKTGKKLSEKSVFTYVTTVQLFINWLARKGYVPSVAGRKGPMAATQAIVEPPSVKPIDTLSRAEIKQLERAARDERDKLIIRVLADTGMREGELCSLTVDSLVETRLKAKGESGRFLRIFKGKSGWRDVPIIDSDVWQRLKNYRDRLRPSNAKTDALFLVRRRHVAGGDYDAITESGVYQLIKAVGDEAGISRAHPHLFRHSAATWMLQNGLDSVTVARVLGHKSLNMINRVYAHIAPSDTFSAMVKYLSD